MLAHWDFLSNKQVVGFLIPLAAVVGGMTMGIIGVWFKHRERMAMIARGIDPGSSDEAYKNDNV